MISGTVDTSYQMVNVVYNGNGNTEGTVPEDSARYDIGDTVTVLGNIGSMTKDGYTFGGWNTDASGDGITYQAGETFTITKNTTLYAKWKGATVNVTLTRNGSPLSDATITAKDSNGTTKIQDEDIGGIYTFSDLAAGDWIFYTNAENYLCDYVKSSCVAGEKYDIDLIQVDPQPCGGRVYYMYNDNGLAYTFYDKDKNPLSITQSNDAIKTSAWDFENVKYYTSQVNDDVVSEPADVSGADKFYAYNNELATGKIYDWLWTQIGSEGKPPYRTHEIGYGRLNTNAVLGYYTTTGNVPGNNTIWYYIQSVNDATPSIGGCSDWFIGSRDELEPLRTSGLVDWFSSNIATSAETFDYASCIWYVTGPYWEYYWHKDWGSAVFAVRAF